MTADTAKWGLIGHEAAVERLRTMVQARRFPPAILVTGAPQSGRSTLARRFAAAAICPNAVAGSACGVCNACRSIDSGTHPDVTTWSVATQEIERGANKSGALTIESVRALSASTALRPRDAERRFAIVEDAEMMLEPAQQALLKTLEDVPGYMTIVLIATQAVSLLETIRSRCVEIALQLVPTERIARTIDGPNADEIARLAVGRPGWALSAGQDSAMVEREKSRVAAVERWMSGGQRARLIEAYQRGDRFYKDRDAVLADLATAHIAWRDVLFACVGAPNLAIDPDRGVRLLIAPYLNAAEVLIAIRAIEQCNRDLPGNVRPRLALQAMVNTWPTL